MFNITQSEKKDGAQVYKLIEEAPFLDTNSSYSYYILCDFYRDTCAVTRKEDDDKLYGFVSCLIPPRKPHTLFVWQVVVDEEARGQGLAKRMIKHIIDNCGADIQYIETTVTDSNTASRKLFESLARDYEAEMKKEPYISEDEFGEDGHETEMLYTIGTLKK